MDEIVADNQLTTAWDDVKREERETDKGSDTKKAWPETKKDSLPSSPRADTQGPLKKATVVPKFATRWSSVGKTALDDSYSDSGYADDDLDDEEEEDPNKYLGKTICKRCPRCVKAMNCILDNKIYIAVMTIITIWALYADDIRVLAVPWSMDSIFFGINSAGMFMFLVELGLSSLAQDGYLLGFYFWLDLIATVSMISDVGWVWNLIIPITEIEDADIS